MSAPLLVFDRDRQRLHLLADGVTSWTAANNAATVSRGPWPPGVYKPERLLAVGGPDGLPGGAYGPWFLRYAVPGRIGMGVHAGREGDADGRGRSGPQHATLGCIRTSAEAVEEIERVIREAGGQLPPLWVPR